MKNIFFAIHAYSGAQTYAAQLKKYLDTTPDIRMHIIYLGSFDYREFTILSDENVFEFHIPFPGKRDMKIYSRRIIDLLSPWIDTNVPAIIHLNRPDQYHLGYYFKERYGARIIYTLHFLTNDFTVRAIYPSSGESDFRDKSGDSRIIALADQVICVTRFAEWVIKEYYKKNPESVRMIYNGFESRDLQGKVSEEKKRSLKSLLGFPPQTTIILYVGRLDETKGCNQLANVFSKLSDTYPDARLIFVGNGNYNQCLKHIGSHCAKVHFTGQLPPPELRTLYQIADIGVVPSLWEQCSYVALEMMAHSLPVIYSRIPGLCELFDDGIDGLGTDVTPGNPPYYLEVKADGLTEALAMLLTNPTRRSGIGKAAHKKWQTLFTSERMGQKTHELYNTKRI